jgi:hypothetical protein
MYKLNNCLFGAFIGALIGLVSLIFVIGCAESVMWLMDESSVRQVMYVILGVFWGLALFALLGALVLGHL